MRIMTINQEAVPPAALADALISPPDEALDDPEVTAPDAAFESAALTTDEDDARWLVRYWRRFTHAHAQALVKRAGLDRPRHRKLSSDLGDALAEDCAALIGAHWATLRTLDPEQAGSDFALARNRSGRGFWRHCLGERGDDDDWDRLTRTAHNFPKVTLYVGGDGLLHA